MAIVYQFQHVSIIDPSKEDLSDMGALGFSVKGLASYMGMTTVYFSRPRPCTACHGKRSIKGSDGAIPCKYCQHTQGFEPVSPVAEMYYKDRQEEDSNGS